jgi:protein-S-isoprenylcysteine O-methyltransferase Ste14
MTIEQISEYANLAAFGVVIISWFVFAGTFLLRKKPAAAPDAKRDPRSWAGLALQGVGFGFVWAIRRTPFDSPLIDGQFAINILLQIIAIVVVISSVWLAMAAIKELGKQWSLQARLIEGHKLVRTGVYNLVRHPIYTAMLGMLLATGLAFSHWLALLTGVLVFLIGTKIRTNFEESLLDGAFGEEFKDWKAKVPGLIPFVKI